jgi:hypothetical protein
MKKNFALLLLILAGGLLAGCGGNAFYGRRGSFDQFSLESKGHVQPVVTSTNLTEAKVKELWGQPDSTRTENNGMTVWRYRGDVAVRGAFLVLCLVPVPLIVPTGHDYVDIYFKEGVAVKVVTSDTATKEL